MPDYASLKAELALPAYDGKTDAEILALLGVQTVTASDQSFTWSAARAIARRSLTGDWARVIARSRQTPALPPLSANDEAVLAALAAVETDDADQFSPADPDRWSMLQARLAILVTTGDVSQDTATAILALSTPTLARWPDLTVGDLQTARAQP